jgi:hypothetical protein
MILDMPYDMVKATVVPFFTLRDLVVYQSALGPKDKVGQALFDALIEGTALPQDRSITINDHSAKWMHEHNVYASDIVVASTATGGVVPYFQASGHHVTSLALHDCTLLSAVHLRAILHFCSYWSSLNRFDVTGSNRVDIADLKQFLHLNEQLRHVSLDFDSHMMGNLYHSPYVESIDLSGCVNVKDSTVMLIARHCKQLRSLDLSNAMYLRDGAVNALAEEARQLESLLICQSAKITDVCLTNFCVQRGRSMRVLGINGTLCGPAVLEHIAGHLPNLQDLRLHSYPAALNATFARLVQSCPQLRALEVEVGRLRGLATEGVFPFAKLHKLVAVEARGGRLCDSHLTAYAVHWTSIQHLELMLNETITDDALAGIASHCALLHTLHLFGGASLRDTSLTAIVAANPHLRAIKLTCANNLTDEFLLAIACQCPGMTTLEVAQGEMFTDIGVAGIALQAPQLTVLALPHSVLLTDQTLRALAAHCPQLTALNLARSDLLTAQVVQHALQRCRRLRSLDLEHGTLSYAQCMALEKRYGIRELEVRAW